MKDSETIISKDSIFQIVPKEEYLNSLNNDSIIITSSLKFKNLKKTTEFNYTILYRARDLMNKDFTRKQINVKKEKDSIIINHYMNIKGYSTVIPYCKVSDSVIDINYYRPTDVSILFINGKHDTSFNVQAIANILQLEICLDKKKIGKRKIKIKGKDLNQYEQFKDYIIRPGKAHEIAQNYISKNYNNRNIRLLTPEIYCIEDSSYYFNTNFDIYSIKVNALNGKASQAQKP